MDQELRVKYFERLKKEDPYSYKDVYYQGRTQKLPVFRIDLSYLVFNRWNGRIASLVKSYEHENGVELDASDPKCYEIIEKFLWESNQSANENTLASIKSEGQKEYGIVTKDGVIIDGNRRAMILRKKAHEKKESPAYFLGVVLDEKLFDNHKEIMRLETTYQMGEDAKVDYEPIEKYLKCKDMIAAGFTAAEIGKMMGQPASKVSEYLEIMELMDEYLAYLRYDGIYTRLDKTEDLFINLNKVLQKWTKTSGKIRWNHKKDDISDFKLICFDCIRYVYNAPKGIQSKEVRDYLTRNSEDGIFTNEKIWRSFAERHVKVEKISNTEKSIDELKAESGSRSLSSILKSRDEGWAREVDPMFKENFGLSIEALKNQKEKNEPQKLLQSALDKLQAIDIDSKPFINDPTVLELVDEIRKTAEEFKRIISKKR